jgi:hypothetical protein
VEVTWQWVQDFVGGGDASTMRGRLGGRPSYILKADECAKDVDEGDEGEGESGEVE